MDLPQEKKVAKLNDITHLVIFSESLYYVYKNMDSPESISSVFYNLAILGEIVSQSNSSKLSESVYKLLPLKACQNIVEIRNNHLSHVGYATAINGKEIFESLKISREEFLKFYEFSLRVILQQGSIFICSKLNDYSGSRNSDQ